jgi:hypothetical protein
LARRRERKGGIRRLILHFSAISGHTPAPRLDTGRGEGAGSLPAGPAYVTNRINCSTVSARMPNIRWPYTLSWPRTRTSPAAVAVLQRAVDALSSGALVIAQFFGRLVAGAPPGPRLGLERGFAAVHPAGMAVNNRHMPERAGFGPDLRRVAGTVHQIVAIGHPLRRHDRQRNGGLTVVQGGGGQQSGHGNVTVSHVDMQLVTGAGGRLFLAQKRRCLASPANSSYAPWHCASCRCCRLTADQPASAAVS